MEYKSYRENASRTKATLKAARAYVQAARLLAGLNAEVKDWNIGIGNRAGIIEVELVDKNTGSCTWWTV